KMLIGAGVLALGTLGLFWYKNKKKKEQQTLDVPHEVVEPAQIPASATPSYNGNANASTTATGKDIYKILKFGSKGNEVKALQTELKVSADGKFGNQTLTALQKARGVNQISLFNFFKTKQATPVKPVESATAESPFTKGQRIMVNIRSGFTAQDVQVKADGTYFTNGTNKITGLDFGDKIGVIKSVLKNASNGTVRYVVENTFLGVNRLLWVAHKNVALIK
ncbi:peptidoglycan-binding protein, partial [Flavobacterium sp.]|uniref:peptidoglycan-binding domain-containing protein n=1 Tax=Flavobacterium sp. TaxID=239 RepID=UPI00374CC8CB